MSVLDAVQRRLPHAPLVYAADTAGYPYGTRSEREIAARVPALLGRLAERYDPRLIVIACNTASTIALDAVRAALDLPIVGTVPAIKPAALLSATRVIGVLGTEATVRQPYVDRLAVEFAADCTILRHGSAELVDLAEAKLRGEAIDARAVEDAVAPLRDRDGGKAIDTIVLACTHFPLLADELQDAIGRPVRFVDGAEGIARRVAFLTAGVNWPASPDHRAVVTGGVACAERYRMAFGHYGIRQVDALGR